MGFVVRALLGTALKFGDIEALHPIQETPSAICDCRPAAGHRTEDVIEDRVNQPRRITSLARIDGHLPIPHHALHPARRSQPPVCPFHRQAVVSR